MRRLGYFAFAFACWATGLSGCAPLADADEVSDDACSPGTRLCNDYCVDVDDAGYGCGDLSCTPCDFPDANADTGYGNAHFECGPPTEGPPLNRCKLLSCLDGFTGTRCQCFPEEPCDEATLAPPPSVENVRERERG